MSLGRLVYYSALLGGWAAFVGWLFAELLFFRSGAASGRLQVAASGGLVGSAIGLGLGAVAAAANGQWKQFLLRGLPGFVGGGFGGALGAFLGDVLFAIGLPRGFGWMILGLAIGSVEGLYERSGSKLRNGLIGGALGGLIGGSLFTPIQLLISHGAGMSSRAAAFVILGVSIGVMIGLVQVVLKQAWLTVLDGYRAGRQLILSQQVTMLGRGDHLPLPFLGPTNRDLESEHVKIMRQAGGAFVVEDNHSRLGVRLNNQPLMHPTTLKDGDVIKFGGNFVRFNERKRKQGEEPISAAPAFQVRAAPPPPPIRKPAGAPAATPSASSPPAQTPAPAKPQVAAAPKPPAPAAARPGAIPPPPPPRKPQP
ncbi:MAG TPA: FHA domain-containing protein [Pirellulales bacterium]|nr:FHA domain-containing protein [Pirellulales bacterium]